MRRGKLRQQNSVRSLDARHLPQHCLVMRRLIVASERLEGTVGNLNIQPYTRSVSLGIARKIVEDSVDGGRRAYDRNDALSASQCSFDSRLGGVDHRHV